MDRIVALLRRDLKTRRPGERLPSIESLSRQWKASVNTVYAAVHILQRENLLAARHGSGVYVTDRATPTCVGILIDTDILDSRVSGFHVQAPRALRRYLFALKMRTRLYLGFSPPGEAPNPVPPPEFIEDLADGRLDGVITFNMLPDETWLAEAEQRGVPVVGNRWYRYGVDFDVLEVIPEAVRRLRRAGCRNLALLAWGAQTVESAFRQALAAEALPYREGWVRHDLHPLDSGAGWEELREIWSAYPEKPDGLIITDDHLFREALPAILSLSVPIPERLRIAAHANKGSEIRAPFPVAWFCMDPDRYARHQANLLLQLLRGESPADAHIRVPFEWVDELSPSPDAGRDSPAGIPASPHSGTASVSAE